MIFSGLLFGDHGEEGQVPVAVVDEAVCVSLGAVVASAGGERLIGPVTQDLAGAGEDIDHLTVRLVGVQADGGPGGELALQDFYRAVAPLFQVDFLTFSFLVYFREMTRQAGSG